MASGSKVVIYAALVGNAAITVTKFAASLFTGSSAMLTEAIHSLVDTGNQGLLLWGLRKARQPPDENFPFGHGKEIYFWSFVVAIMIFALGSGISIYEGIKHLIEAFQDPHHVGIKDPTINYIVLGLAAIFEGGALYFAWREFDKHKGEMGTFEAVRHGKDPTMFMVLLEDSAAMAGLVIAFLGIWLGQVTGLAYFDGGASVLIGLLLGGVALILARETKGLIIGESADSGLRRGIRERVAAHEGIKHVNELLTLHMGPENVIVTMSVDFVDGLKSEDVEASVGSLNSEIKDAYPEVLRVFIEVESYLAHQAQIARASQEAPNFDDHHP